MTTEWLHVVLKAVICLHVLFIKVITFFLPLGAAEAERPESEEAGAGDGQSQFQEPAAGQEGGAATRGAGC